MPEEPKGQRIEIELPEETAQGIYSNLVITSHSPSEFVLDFTRVLPGLKKARVYSRIILSPKHSKALLKTLTENINKFEKKFGEIKIEDLPKKEIGF
ncbi:DUF3467 domain-containing protein [candidate division WOR-3 bacterium]|nr:DUF3467 domain-containing protein [candidate division WOR-3 bacterium]